MRYKQFNKTFIIVKTYKNISAFRVIVYSGQMQGRTSVFTALMRIDFVPIQSHRLQHVYLILFGCQMKWRLFLLVLYRCIDIAGNGIINETINKLTIINKQLTINFHGFLAVFEALTTRTSKNKERYIIYILEVSHD